MHAFWLTCFHLDSIIIYCRIICFVPRKVAWIGFVWPRSDYVITVWTVHIRWSHNLFKSGATFNSNSIKYRSDLFWTTRIHLYVSRSTVIKSKPWLEKKPVTFLALPVFILLLIFCWHVWPLPLYNNLYMKLKTLTSVASMFTTRFLLGVYSLFCECRQHQGLTKFKCKSE